MDKSKSAGLSEQEAQERLQKYGKNEIKRVHKINPLQILISQFTSPLIIILVIAALVFLVIGLFPGQDSNIIDTSLILLIVFVSGISGFFQEYKSEKTIEALQNMAVPSTKVIRDGKEREIKVTEIVPGDLILLESGDAVPADAKLVEAFNLRIDEAVLTGESSAVGKKNGDEIYMHTLINIGSAKAIVIKTGMQTKVGNIASKLQTIKEVKTSFQVELAQFSKKISIMILGIIIVVMIVSLFKYNLFLSLFIAISLAVAAIPEGLPAVVVLTLAVAAKEMSSRNALIRKLSVTESIGAVDIVCTDKTGTLTKNEMTVTKLFFNNKIFDTDGIRAKTSPNLKMLLLSGLLCNNSRAGQDSNNEKKYLGDQTEVALRKLSEKADLDKLASKYTRINEFSFTSKRKMMSVVYKYQDKNFVYSKGAPEVLIKKCNRIYSNGKILKLDSSKKEQILNQNKEFASEALRVLGFAYKETKNTQKGVEEKLIWLGLQAMIDPPRSEVKEALEQCKTAGIRVIILTGDNPLTAKAIAEKIGLKSPEVIDGTALDKLNDSQLTKKLATVNIFARISPFHKLRILEILEKNYRVAMTGDGVNDALALKKANVGIAMGIRGTDVAKQASDMILLDDNFASIITAIKEGRRIFDNIRKFVNYLFTCNLAEVGVLLMGSLFLTLQEPILLPIQLLWVNFLTDGLPALALGIDPARPDIMREAPRKKKEGIINKRLAWLITLIGAKKMVILFATFFLLMPEGVDVARTALFTGFILYEFVRIASIRSQEKLGWLANKWLLAALIGSVILQITIIYSPINSYFNVVPLNLYAWEVLLGGIAIGYFGAIAITKLVVAYVKD